ncbi:hypothetical protein F5883DRAFT_671880 [Diaporthe sp. PMI_573]|nr:hypothetical protein F5883DRAFT_671880 [Diaporthaceae sp. PMI_573]
MTLEPKASLRKFALPINNQADLPSVASTSASASIPASAPCNHQSASFLSASSYPAIPPGPLTATVATPSHPYPQQPPPGASRNCHQPSEEAIRLAAQLVTGRGFDISRYGLTAAATVRDQSGLDAVASVNGLHSPSFAWAAPPFRKPAQPWKPPDSQGFALPRLKARRTKRPVDQGQLDDAFITPAAKKPRRPTLGSLDLPKLAPPRIPEDLPLSNGVSPLFFSNSSSKHMTGRPPSFSTSEPSGAMIHRLRDEQGTVRTVRLPRGHVSSASPARAQSMSTPGSGGSAGSQSSRALDSRLMSPELQDLHGVGVIELLDQDERPTFIIDLMDTSNFGPGPLKVVWRNAALRAAAGVDELISKSAEGSVDFSRFKAWTVSFVKEKRPMDVCLPSLSYGGISWTCSTVRNRFRFVSGNSAAVSITPTSPAPIARASSILEQRSQAQSASRDTHTPGRERALSDLDYFGDAEPDQALAASRRAHSEPRDLRDMRPDTPIVTTDDVYDCDDPLACPVSFDWTRIVDTSSMLPHLQFARSKDWAATPLGPIEGWPADLRTMSNMIMGSPHPAAMYWGPEHTALYNEAYLDLAGNKHPKLMGQSYTEAWAEIWDEIKPVFNAAWNHGQATMKQDDRLFLNRNGFLEETFFNWSIVPLLGCDGSVVALYNPAFENTRRKVNERRMLTLREIGESTSHARNVGQFWKRVHESMKYNEWDIPFALIYSVTEDSESEVSSMHSGSVVNPPQIILEGSIGISADHPAATPWIDLKTSEEGFAPYMRRSMAQPMVPVVLSKDDGTLPQSLIEGIEWRGFGDPSRNIVVFPVHPTTGDTVVGFVVMGINPRRPYNDDYRLFVNLMCRQLATSMASVVLFEEEIKRGQQAARLAALDRQQLSIQLRLRTQEAVESEYKFTRLAEFAPVGIFIANAEGNINFCNDSWWEISRHPRTINSINTWMESVLPVDRPTIEAAWRRLIDEKVSIVQEFRFKARREFNGHPIDTWALMSAYPEKDSDGAVKAVFGVITDISQQKWAEAFQNQRREEAVELKRQQENFIDMTSHEMRNPLSALCQCADEIIGSIGAYRKSEPEVAKRLSKMLETCLEAANTISLCSNHQKRIVDDVLTLSRLDSRMVEVTPTVVSPVEVIQASLKMFDAELASSSIKADFRIDQSYRDLGIELARLDPARLQQVIINLLTNAIKFIQKQEERSIVITLAASKEACQSQICGIEFFQDDPETQQDITDKADWGTGEKFNLHVCVADTGPGLTDEERSMLFQRFRQTSPRTHVEYGGSGLGLFISRMLTELQGGQIGVVSEKGVGSTFAFYIKSRKSVEPQLPSPHTDGADFLTIQPAINPGTIDVLVVEDNQVNQKVLGRLLRNSGFRAHLANHGGEAIQKLQRSRHWDHEAAIAQGFGPLSPIEEQEDMIDVSIILMDLEMPVMDGTTCARTIRELEKQGVLTAHIPIIAVTAYVRPEQIGEALASGMDDIVSKPFRARELTPKITELLLKSPAGQTPYSPLSMASPNADPGP